MRSLIAFVLVPLLTACTASSSVSDEGVSQAELTTIDTSQCPNELRVQVGARVAWVNHDLSALGAGLSMPEVVRLVAVMDKADQLRDGRPIVVEARDPERVAGSCIYRQAPDLTAVLRKNPNGAGSVFELRKGDLSVVAFPRRMAPEGVLFWEVMDRDSELLAIVSEPGEPNRAITIGGVDVHSTGEQIANRVDLSAIRLPVLRSSLAPLHDLAARYDESIVIDSEHGGKYMRYKDRVELVPDVELLSKASPTAFQTNDPDTTICFLGPASGACAILASFRGSVFSDGFTQEQCSATDGAVTMTFHSEVSTGSATVIIPRCE